MGGGGGYGGDRGRRTNKKGIRVLFFFIFFSIDTGRLSFRKYLSPVAPVIETEYRSILPQVPGLSPAS